MKAQINVCISWKQIKLSETQLFLVLDISLGAGDRSQGLAWDRKTLLLSYVPSPTGFSLILSQQNNLYILRNITLRIAFRVTL
jgi:hypothetical protein